MPDASPRTLFVCHTASLGGAELTLLDIAAGVEGARVLLFEDGPFRERLHARGVAVESIPGAPSVLAVRRDGGLLSAVRAAPGVARLVAAVATRARAADVVYANSQKAFVVAALAGRLARRPVVWHLHDLLTADHFSPSRLRLAVWLGNRFADRVVVGSEAVGRAFTDAGGDGRKVRLVYYGVDSAPFDAVTAEAEAAARRSLAVPDGPVVGVFGRIDTWKGQEVLLDALPQVPGVHGLVVGGAPWGQEALADALRDRADVLGVADRVTFAGFRDDVPALMRVCSVVAHTSTLAEPFGRVIVEGMLAGRPVVATDAGGAREIVTDGETGWLVPPGDPAALATALTAALTGGGTDRVTRQAARDARDRFSVGTMIEGVERTLHELTAPPGVRRK